MNLERIRTEGIPDGAHPLPSGGVVVIEDGLVSELRAPMRPDADGRGATVQWVTTEEAGEMVGCLIFAGLWRVERTAYVAGWPVRMPLEESAGLGAY
jgi:hypothetical protein